MTSIDKFKTRLLNISNEELRVVSKRLQEQYDTGLRSGNMSLVDAADPYLTVCVIELEKRNLIL